MPENPQVQSEQIVKDLQEMQAEMAKEKIELSPEMKKYLAENLGAVQDKLANREPIFQKDLEFVGDIRLWLSMPKVLREKYPSIEALKLAGINKEIVQTMKKLDISYDEMIDTLDDNGYTDKVPNKETVMDAVFNLGIEMIKKIGKFGKPTLLVTPAVNLKFMKNKIDVNKKYANANGKLQNDTFFDPAPNDALWGPKQRKLKVTIVDGMPAMPQLPVNVVQMDWEHKHKYLTDEYKKQGMKMITSYEYAMLAQRSLRSFQKAKNDPNKNPEDEIIDKNTITTFNGEHLMDLKEVPYGHFNPDTCRFSFFWYDSDLQDNDLRSRPSVQVMEI
jgi:hypothetical protein